MSTAGTESPQAEPPRPPKRARRWAFRLAAMAIPVVLLALVELALRTFGYGGYAPVLKPVGPFHGGTLVTTYQRGAASYFYANRSKPGSINDTAFITPKPRGTVRIMMLGESAAKGFPQSPAFAATAFLDAMLSDIWPGRSVEVLNFGTTAIASFPVLDMLREAVQFEPDLCIIYCGNNEFYGAYGVASLHRAGSTPAAIRFQRWLRSLALVQFVERLSTRSEATDNKTLMEAVVGRSHLSPHDPLRDAAERNLYEHVSAMIDVCNSNHIPVIVCTPPANERDLAPLGRSEDPELPAAQADRIRSLMTQAVAQTPTQPAKAIESYKEVLALAPDLAEAHFALGTILSRQRDFAAAASQFQAAIDDDPMPWRATSAQVDAIRRAAKDRNAVLCDLVKVFREASPGGAMGWELMDDHVHPSLDGQAALAAAIVRSMSAIDGPARVSPEDAQKLKSSADYTRQLGDNIYDRYGVAHTVRVLCTIPFFKETNPDALKRFEDTCRDLELRMSPAAMQAARDFQKPQTHRGAQRPIAGMVGKALIREGRFADAEPLFAVALRCLSPWSSWHIEYTYFYLACRSRNGKPLSDSDRDLAAAAIERGQFLLNQRASESGATERYMGRLHQLRGEQEKAVPLLEIARKKVPRPDLFATDQALLEAYIATRRFDEARIIARQGAESAGEYAETYRKVLESLPKP